MILIICFCIFLLSIGSIALLLLGREIRKNIKLEDENKALKEENFLLKKYSASNEIK